MTSVSKEIYRKASVTRSYSSDLGTVREEREDDMERSLVFENSPGEEQTSEELSTGSDTGSILGSPQSSTRSREVMKTKIKYHYMNPCQKFRARRRKPWKLLVQIVKVFLITIQVCCNDSRKLEKLNNVQKQHPQSYIRDVMRQLRSRQVVAYIIKLYEPRTSY